MAEQNDFTVRVAELRDEIEQLQGPENPEVIEDTARRLEKLNYAPPLALPLDRFFRLNKTTLREEVEHLLSLPDAEVCALAPNEPKKCRDLRIQFISVLLFYYRKLELLRSDDGEAWDEIDELYIHD